MDVAKYYLACSKNYKNLFDAKSGFMRAKDSNGAFRDEVFDSFAWGRDYTEGSAWQNSFAVPQDYVGLAALYGGKEAFLKKVDEVSYVRYASVYRSFKDLSSFMSELKLMMKAEKKKD
jgi:putative alpha-1,2-mannosidase